MVIYGNPDDMPNDPVAGYNAYQCSGHVMYTRFSNLVDMDSDTRC